MASTRLLIIDSDQAQALQTQSFLSNYGFAVSVKFDATDLGLLTSAEAPQFIIVGDNETVAKIRALRSTPIVVVSSKAEVSDRIAGLEAGADDYLAKPCDLKELVARIHTVLRRASALSGATTDYSLRDHEVREWRFKGLVVQSNRRRVLLDGQAVELTTAEFDLLRLLVANAETVLSRERILEELRGIEWEALDRSIDILVSRLREKLSDEPRKPRFIRTIRSVGYQFVGELAEESAEAGVPSPEAMASALPGLSPGF